MTSQNDYLIRLGASSMLEAFTEVEFLGSEKLLTEPAEFSKGAGLTEYERTGHPSLPLTQAVPATHKPPHRALKLVQSHRRPTANARLGLYGSGDVTKQSRAG